MGLVGKPDAATLGPLEAAGLTGIIATPWQLDDPRVSTLEAKEAAIAGYAQRFIA